MPTNLQHVEQQHLPLDIALITQLTATNRSLARFDGMVQSIPNPLLFLTNLTKAEAVDSSRIEGTQATIDDLYAQESGEEYNSEKVKDLEEVNNYEAALSFGAASIKERDLSTSLIKEMHARLMQGVRGCDKTPGAFRIIQNWIGRAGSTMESAEYVPPEPVHVEGLLDEMISFYQTSELDILIKAALIHAQFEAIHPFLDGNGRLGRLLIPLILCRHGVLAQPVFYLSSYLEAHRTEYYRALNGTHRLDWITWLSFFLRAIDTQAQQNIAKISNMRELYARYVEEFSAHVKGAAARELVEALFTHPIFTLKTLEKKMHGRVGLAALRSWIGSLSKAGYVDIIEEGQGRRPTRYRASEIMSVLR